MSLKPIMLQWFLGTVGIRAGLLCQFGDKEWYYQP